MKAILFQLFIVAKWTLSLCWFYGKLMLLYLLYQANLKLYCHSFNCHSLPNLIISFIALSNSIMLIYVSWFNCNTICHYAIQFNLIMLQTSSTLLSLLIIRKCHCNGAVMLSNIIMLNTIAVCSSTPTTLCCNLIMLPVFILQSTDYA